MREAPGVSPGAFLLGLGAATHTLALSFGGRGDGDPESEFRMTLRCVLHGSEAVRVYWGAPINGRNLVCLVGKLVCVQLNTATADSWYRFEKFTAE